MHGLEAHLTLDTQKMTQKCLSEALAQGSGGDRFVLAGENEESTLQIVPYMVFSFVDKEKARLWVILKTSLVDNNFNQVDWKCRYIAALGEPRTFNGQDGWASLQPREIEAEAIRDTQEAVRAFLADLQGKLRNEQAPREKVNGCWVFYKRPRKVDVKFLVRGDRDDIVLPMVGDGEYFAGVNILPKDFYQAMDKK
jgi:hypothetical protein